MPHGARAGGDDAVVLVIAQIDEGNVTGLERGGADPGVLLDQEGDQLPILSEPGIDVDVLAGFRGCRHVVAEGNGADEGDVGGQGVGVGRGNRWCGGE